METTYQEMAVALKGSGALLSFDLGVKTIGLAVSDAGWRIATPLKTLRRTTFTHDIQELKKIIAGRDIQGLVMGLPLNMDESEGPRAQSTRSFARNLAPLISLPLVFC